MNDDIHQRINRIYAAIGTIEENNLNNLKAIVISTEKVKGFYQNFRDGLSDDELSNQAIIVIHNIANLRDHLRRWASHNNQDKNDVDQVFMNSFELKIIKDLSNNEKHGYPPRDGGRSKKFPQLININRKMNIKTQTNKGSWSGIIIGTNGIPKSFGDGTAKAVVTGDVVDNENNRIGDLYDITNKAVEAWENLLVNFGLITTKKDTSQD